MTDVATQRLSFADARDLTEEVKADAAALWRKLLRLYEGEAHLALEYSSWGDYFEEEFGGSQSRAYQLLDAGRVLDAVETHSKVLERPRNDDVARALVPLLRAEGPEVTAEAWEDAVMEYGPGPTAPEVREVVRDYVPRPTPVNSGLAGVGLGGRRRQAPTIADAIAAHDDAWREFHERRGAGQISAARLAAKEAWRALKTITDLMG